MSTLVNRGTIEFAADGSILQNGPSADRLMTLRNEAGGRIIKTGAGNDETDFVAKLINRGTFRVETGNLTLFRESDFSSPLEVLPGATVSFRAGTSTPSIFRSGTQLTGGGEVILRTAVELEAGAVVDAGSISLQSSSRLFGSGTLRVTGSGEWQSGTLDDQVVLEIAPGGTMTLSGTGSRSVGTGASPTIRNRGLFEIASTANLSSNGSALFENEGTLVLTEAGRFAINSGDSTELVNTGTIIKEAGVATGNNARSILPVDLRHEGVLEVRSGILDVFGAHEIASPILVEDGAILRLDGNETTTFLAGGSVTGRGSLEHKGSDIIIPAGVRTSFSNYKTPSGSGEVRGEGTFVLADDSSFTRLNHIRPGTTEVAPGANLEITPGSFRLSEGRIFHVLGEVDFPGSFSFSATNGMTLRNEGVMIFRDSSSWIYSGGNYVIENTGVIRLEAAPNDTIPFGPDEISGSGLFDVVSGRLRFARPVEFAGNIRIAAGAQLNGSGLTLGPASTVSGTGLIGSSVTLNGRVAPGLSIGTLNVSGSATFTPSGSLEVEMGDGTSDQLAVISTLDLGGLTILPTPVAGYTPSVGDSWVIATAGSITGSVGLVSQAGAAPGFGYFLTQSGNELTLTYEAVESFQDAIEAAIGVALGENPDLTAFATGDLDGDGVQDLTDWAFGGTLGGADPGRSLRIDSILQTSPTTRELVIAFPIRSIVSDVTISLEGDPDLDGIFNQVTFALAGTEVRNGILFQTGTVALPVSASRNFLRVRVALN
ncbi:hypothetical protein N9B63_02440 [Akkermansiaceae bacterium]|nr:hypothetical protein [Akkermansiaceae bacterium]